MEVKPSLGVTEFQVGIQYICYVICYFIIMLAQAFAECSSFIFIYLFSVWSFDIETECWSHVETKGDIPVLLKLKTSLVYICFTFINHNLWILWNMYQLLS